MKLQLQFSQRSQLGISLVYVVLIDMLLFAFVIFVSGFHFEFVHD